MEIPVGKWLLLIDLDGTLWDHLDISSLKPPFKKIGEGKIRDIDGVEVTLNRDIVDLVKWARRNGAITSTLSWNIPWKAYKAIETFSIMSIFDYITVMNSDRKDEMIKDLLNKLREMGILIDICRIVYIDDRDIHIKEIYKNIGKIFFLQYGRDFSGFEDGRERILKHLSTCKK